jgi:hypothetical protein
MAHGPLYSVPEVVSILCWHEGFEHAADAAPDALDVLRAGSGSVFDAAGFFAALPILCCAFVRAEAQWRPL